MEVYDADGNGTLEVGEFITMFASSDLFPFNTDGKISES